MSQVIGIFYNILKEVKFQNMIFFKHRSEKNIGNIDLKKCTKTKCCIQRGQGTDLIHHDKAVNTNSIQNNKITQNKSKHINI